MKSDWGLVSSFCGGSLATDIRCHGGVWDGAGGGRGAHLLCDNGSVFDMDDYGSGDVNG